MGKTETCVLSWCAFGLHVRLPMLARLVVGTAGLLRDNTSY